MLAVGLRGFVPSESVRYIGVISSRAIRRLIEKAEEKGVLIDATSGRKTRAIIVLDSTHVVLATLTVETLVQRFEREHYGKKVD